MFDDNSSFGEIYFKIELIIYRAGTNILSLIAKESISLSELKKVLQCFNLQKNFLLALDSWQCFSII
jgi:hypothetical protein